jgi:hypothetical protein
MLKARPGDSQLALVISSPLSADRAHFAANPGWPSSTRFGFWCWQLNARSPMFATAEDTAAILPLCDDPRPPPWDDCVLICVVPFLAPPLASTQTSTSRFSSLLPVRAVASRFKGRHRPSIGRPGADCPITCPSLGSRHRCSNREEKKKQMFLAKDLSEGEQYDLRNCTGE